MVGMLKLKLAKSENQYYCSK